MNVQTAGWLGLVILLCFTTFGTFWCFMFIFGVVSFIIGLLTLLYLQTNSVEDIYFHNSLLENPLNVPKSNVGGLKRVIELIGAPKSIHKTDQRVTGSEVIDSSLQEIFGYIIRDYISPWYQIISNDSEFPDESIRKSGQKLAINLSNRVKETDWLPFLTTRLVDDVAAHLRLFRRARSETRIAASSYCPGQATRRHSAALSHRRNKSEADATRPAPPTDVQLLDAFFRLECKMENNLLCRDAVCMDSKKEMEYLSELTETLLYLLLPDADFQCKSVRFVLRELFCNCILKPLLDLLSDPDYINQMIVWLCFRDSSLPSDIFLTTLRLSEDSDDLRYTKELVTQEIQLLRSRDSGGESDTAIKQQLSSLNYVIKVIDNRLAKIIDDPGYSSEQKDLSNLLVSSEACCNLPLDEVLKNNVALSYLIDYVTNIGQQCHLYFYLSLEGWRERADECGDNYGEDTNLRDELRLLYEQYLHESNTPRDEHLTRKLLTDSNEPASSNWTDHLRIDLRTILSRQLRSLSGNTTPKNVTEIGTQIGPLDVRIVEAGVVKDVRGTYGVYATRVRNSGSEWHVYRRYSDYYDLNSRISTRWPDSSRPPFPAKKTFHNMERGVLERRMRMLNAYLESLCGSESLTRHVGLRDELLAFLRQGEAKTTNVNPPSDSDVPVRVVTLLADEVFELRGRNQWLRRRIVTLLRQLVGGVFGEVVNRRILDYVSFATRPASVARLLHACKRSLWPEGVATRFSGAPRGRGVRARTRVAAASGLLAALPDELRHIIGAETARHGLLTVFQLLQAPVLNRRLLHVVLQGLLSAMFPNVDLFQRLCQKMHARSRRVVNR